MIIFYKKRRLTRVPAKAAGLQPRGKGNAGSTVQLLLGTSNFRTISGSFFFSFFFFRSLPQKFSELQKLTLYILTNDPRKAPSWKFSLL